MFIAFLAAAAAAVPQATPINLGSWFTPNDYPQQAMRSGLTGSVTFDVDVDASGKPTACRVIASSGHQVLDQATCDLVLARGKFVAASGPDGKAIAGHYSNRAVWELPAPPQPAPPPGQTTTGSRLPVPGEDLPFTASAPHSFLTAPVNESDRDSYTVAEKFGACLVKTDPATSMQFVMATPGSDASDAARQNLMPHMPDCLGASIDPFAVGEIRMTIQPPMARGVIAEALYKLQFANPPQATNPVQVAPILPASATDSSNLNEAIVYDFAQCVTDANPSAVRSLVLSKIGSHDEQAAISELVPSLSPCLYKGQMLRVDRPTFRARFAEALYRWSVTAAQSH